MKMAKTVLIIRIPETTKYAEKYLFGAFKSKLLLALQSKLPNEIDWALNKLVRLSFTLPPNFHIGSIPDLVETLIDLLQPFFAHFPLSLKSNIQEPSDTSISLFTRPKSLELLERTLQVLHVIRNLSSLEQNAKFFTSFPTLLTILAKGIYSPKIIKSCNLIGISIPESSFHVEVKQHCLDIVEFMATHIQLSGHNDFYLVYYMKLVFENDRAPILCAIRTLTRFCVHEGNQAILAGLDDEHLLKRLYQLLLVSDEELVSAILDYIYQYSSLGTDIASKLALVKDFNSVKFLSKFLLWKGFPQPLAQPQVHSFSFYRCLSSRLSVQSGFMYQNVVALHPTSKLFQAERLLVSLLLFNHRIRHKLLKSPSRQPCLPLSLRGV